MNKHLCSQLIDVTTFTIDESSPFPESGAQEVEGLGFSELQGTCILYFLLNGFWRVVSFFCLRPMPSNRKKLKSSPRAPASSLPASKSCKTSEKACQFL